MASGSLPKMATYWLYSARRGFHDKSSPKRGGYRSAYIILAETDQLRVDRSCARKFREIIDRKEYPLCGNKLWKFRPTARQNTPFPRVNDFGPGFPPDHFRESGSKRLRNILTYRKNPRHQTGIQWCHARLPQRSRCGCPHVARWEALKIRNQAGL